MPIDQQVILLPTPHRRTLSTRWTTTPPEKLSTHASTKALDADAFRRNLTLVNADVGKKGRPSDGPIVAWHVPKKKADEGQ